MELRDCPFPIHYVSERSHYFGAKTTYEAMARIMTGGLEGSFAGGGVPPWRQ